MPADDPLAPDPLARVKALASDLADLGMAVARALHDRIVPTDDAAPPAPDIHLPALARAFDGVSTGIRRSILLVERLHAPPNAAPDPVAARKRIIREVEDGIARAGLDPDHADHLTAELHDRLERPELQDELADRPVDAIITDILLGLGLGGEWRGLPRWKRRTPEDVADLADRAARLVLARVGLPTSDAQPERHHRLLATPVG